MITRNHSHAPGRALLLMIMRRTSGSRSANPRRSPFRFGTGPFPGQRRPFGQRVEQPVDLTLDLPLPTDSISPNGDPQSGIRMADQPDLMSPPVV